MTQGRYPEIELTLIHERRQKFVQEAERERALHAVKQGRSQPPRGVSRYLQGVARLITRIVFADHPPEPTSLEKKLG